MLTGILLLLGVTACNQIDPNLNLRAKSGVLDLRDWNWAITGSVSLQGEWAFFPRQLLAPEELPALPSAEADRIEVPGMWRDSDLTASPMPGHGYATYGLRVLLPEDAPPLSMKVIDAGTAYTVYVNGVKMHGAGVIGTTADSSIPDFKRLLFQLPQPSDRELHLVVQVSNYHYRSGGLWNHIALGPTEQLFMLYNESLAYSIGLASAISVIALYHLGLFSLRREDRSTLYFALFCLAIVVRILCTDERFITQLLPGIRYNNMVRLEFMSFLLAPPAALAFLGCVMPRCYVLWQLRAIQVTGVLLAAFVVVTDAALFTEVLPAFQSYLLFCCGFGLLILIQGVRLRVQMAQGFLIGFIIMSLMVINDVLVSIGVLQTPLLLAGVGLFCFIVIQAYAISLRSAQAYASITELTGELENYSADLEQKVEARTRELESANTTLERLAVLDGLTNVANRRKFDEELTRIWAEHRRRGNALSVLLCDIDQFKPYNDLYGHLQGDEALRRVARAIESALARPGDMVARFGGEEFVVLLPDTPIEGALQVAEKILLTVQTLHIPHQSSVSGELTISIGAASMVPGEGVAMAEILLQADQALYRSKTEGRNRITAAA